MDRLRSKAISHEARDLARLPHGTQTSLSLTSIDLFYSTKVKTLQLQSALERIAVAQGILIEAQTL